jgi:hypothetical protein
MAFVAREKYCLLVADKANRADISVQHCPTWQDIYNKKRTAPPGRIYIIKKSLGKSKPASRKKGKRHLNSGKKVCFKKNSGKKGCLWLQTCQKRKIKPTKL